MKGVKEALVCRGVISKEELMRLCRRMIYIDKTPEVMQQIKEMKVGRVLQVDKYR